MIVGNELAANFETKKTNKAVKRVTLLLREALGKLNMLTILLDFQNNIRLLNNLKSEREGK